MLWCANCEKEYDLSLPALCPDCGEELYEISPVTWGRKKTFTGHPNWPMDEKGEPVPPVYLKTVGGGTQTHYELEAGMLEAYGIPVLRDFSALGKFGKLMLGFSGTGMDILVPATMFDEAVALLQDINEQEAKN